METQHMLFTLTITYPTGHCQSEIYDIQELQAELRNQRAIIDGMVRGEKLTVQRVVLCIATATARQWESGTPRNSRYGSSTI